MNNDKEYFRDWIFNGCKHFDMKGRGEDERFICDLNLNLGLTRHEMFIYCTRKCKNREPSSRY